DVLRRLWAGERVTHEGPGFALADVALEYKPAQPELPIVLGVKGPRALALAGALADGVVCSIMSSPAHVRRVRETVAPARGRGGRGPAPPRRRGPRRVRPGRGRRPPVRAADPRPVPRPPPWPDDPRRGRRLRGPDARHPGGAGPRRDGRRPRHRGADRHL